MQAALVGLVALAALVVAVVTGMAGSVVRRRWLLARRPGVFRCSLRSGTPLTCQPRAHGWSGRRLYGEWVHDVLLIHRVGVTTTTSALAVRFPEGNIEPLSGTSHGGRTAAVLRLRLDDDSTVEVAAAAAGRAHLPGPFLAVAALDAGAPADP